MEEVKKPLDPNIPIEPVTPPKKDRKVVLISLGVIPIIALIILLTVGYFTTNKSERAKNISENIVNNEEVTPTPFPFQEMTIPGLRAKKFESTMGEISEVSDNSLYTVYSTNYTSDGLKINAQLTKPTGEKPQGGFPAIVFIHGYIPPSSYETFGQAYSAYVDYLARNGFVVLKIDLRGHGDSDGEPAGGYYSEGYVVDALNAYSAVSRLSFVNPKKVGLWGHSMAGNIVMRSLAANPDIPAAVIWAGAGYTYKDLQDYKINDASYSPLPSDSGPQRRRRELFEKYGQFDPKNEFWKMVVPTNYLSDIKGAIELNHAVDDAVVSINYSRNLNSILDKTNIPHELHEYPSGGHNISGSSFNEAMQNTVNFFKKYF